MHRLFVPEPLKMQRNLKRPNRRRKLERGVNVAGMPARFPPHFCCETICRRRETTRRNDIYKLYQWFKGRAPAPGQLWHIALMLQQKRSMDAATKKDVSLARDALD
jgi:hypothetical protein